MRDTILYLESDPLLRNETTIFLMEAGFTSIVSCSNIYQALEHLEDHGEEVACLITGLRGDPEALEEYVGESDHGFMSGWVMLDRFVFPKYSDLPVIVYAQLLDELHPYLASMGKQHLLGRNNLALAPVSPLGGFRELSEALEKLGIKPG